MKRFRRTRTLVQTGVVTLVIAALAFAGASLIFGSKSGALVSGTDFTITSPSLGPVLYPLTATPSNLPLTFSNRLSEPIRVYSLTVSFTNAFPSGCRYSELTLNDSVLSVLSAPMSAPGVTFSLTGSPIAVPAASGTTPGTATDNMTLALPDNHQNQDACEGLSLALAYNASAYYTDTTTSVLASSPNPSTAGQTITLTDTVTTSADSNVPAGSVLFYSCTGTAVANCSATPLGAAVPLSSGIATTTTKPATAGTYYYEAVYTPPTGSTNFTASTSKVLTQSVSATAGSKVLLWTIHDETIVGSPVTYVADVLGRPFFERDRGPFSYFDPLAVGTVTFMDNGAPIPSCANLPVFFGLATCKVTYRTTSDSPHVIIATYNGDAHHGTGTSNTVSETVYGATSTNEVTNSSPALGGTLKFTATVPGPGVTPAGPFTWKVSGTVTSCPTSTMSLVSGTATCTIIAPRANSTDVVTNSAPPALSGKVVFTATVNGVSGLTPSGSVAWNVSTPSGATACTLTTVLVSGVATCTIPAAKARTYSASDSYVRDANYTSVTSNTDTVTVSTRDHNHLSVIRGTQS